MANYTVLHSHTDLSQAFTVLDSVNNYKQYIDKAKRLGMTAFAFTEHGNVLSWYSKKKYCEEQGLKYIHGVEAYVTETLDEVVDDNYHMVLLAKNKEGFKEINKLCSIASMRTGEHRYQYEGYPEERHFFYVPRITYEELKNTSDNIIILTACLGGILNRGSLDLQKDFINFMTANKDRCFLEVQHHNIQDQADYNKKLYNIHKETGLQLVATTDMHALDDEYLKGREILQKSKDIHFASEEEWDLVFRSYEELVQSFRNQRALPEDIYMQAINNTNKIADMVEEFELNYDFKYPKVHDNPLEVLWEKIYEGLKFRGEPLDEVRRQRIIEEVETFQATKSVDFILYDHELKKFCMDNGIEFGEGRGSVAGSYVCYLLGIHHVNPLEYNLLFSRFMSPYRVTLADIDTDYSPQDIPKIKEYIYNSKGIVACEIITFNTIAYRGAVRYVAKALYLDRCTPEEKEKYSREECERIKRERQQVIDNICNAEDNEELQDEYRREHPELFKYVDMLQGVVVSVGSHPAATVVADRPLDEELGVFHTSESVYPVSQLDMDEIEELNYLKEDILGLKNVGIINDTCKLAGIDRVRDWNIASNDDAVWEDIKGDTIGIFQWENPRSNHYLKSLLSDKTLNTFEEVNGYRDPMTLFVIGSAGIRPVGDSYRDELFNGVVHEYDNEPLDNFLSDTLGHIVFQEQIMQFVNEFCGFSLAESDVVRRQIAHQDEDSDLLEQIEKGFIKTMVDDYNISRDEAIELSKSFLQTIKDASNYGFNKSHSQAYSIIGYQTGYLRYYYPLEFGATYLNYFNDDEEKATRMIDYLAGRGIQIKPPRFRYATNKYMPNKETQTISKGLGSIKYISDGLADELWQFRNEEYDSFVDLLSDIYSKTSANITQIDILIRLNFFEEFGGNKKLIHIHDLFNKWGKRKTINKGKLDECPFPEYIISRHSAKESPKMYRDVDFANVIKDISDNIEDESFGLSELIDTQKEYMRYVDIAFGIDGRYCYIDSIGGKFKNLNMTVVSFNKNQTIYFKIDRGYAEGLGLKSGQCVYIHNATRKPNWRPAGKYKNGRMKFEKTGTYSWHAVDVEPISEKDIVEAKNKINTEENLD